MFNVDKKTILILLSLLCAAEAHAAAITNLSDQPKEFRITAAGQELNVHIDPWRVWTTQAYPVYIHFGGRRMRLDDSTEYAYWPDGTLTPQRRVNWYSGPGAWR